MNLTGMGLIGFVFRDIYIYFFFLRGEYFPNMTQHPSQLCLIARADLKAEILFLEKELRAPVA